MASTEYDITELLTSKPFEQLTDEEQSFVLSELGSESLYREMYNVVQGTADFEAPIMTSSGRDKTFAAFDKLHSTEPDKKKVVFWLKPFVIGLAAASIIGFIWLIGFSDLGKNQTLAENKPPTKKETKDSTPSTENEQTTELEIEPGLNEEESTVEDEKPEKVVQEVEITKNESAPALNQNKAFDEEINTPEPSKYNDADTEDTGINELAEMHLEEDIPAENEESVIRYESAAKSSSDAQGVQPAIIEQVTTSKSARKSGKSQEVNMNSNFSKQSLFKVKLPLGSHYTAY